MHRFPSSPFLLILALSLHAATIARAETLEEHFLMTLGERSLGYEQITLEERGDTLVIEGRLHIELPTERDMTTRTVVVGETDRLLDYVLDTNSGDRIGLDASGDSTRLWVTSARGDREIMAQPSDAKDVVLDNAVPSHMWLLARQFLRDPERARTIRAFVPQSLWHGELEPKKAESVQATLNGAPITVSRHRFTIAGLLSELDVDDTGRALGMHIPMQNFLIHREGYDPAPPTTGDAAPAYPTEEITVEGGGPALGGILTLPASGEGPWPACVLLHGSGPADRDMKVGPNALFVQIAEGLAERGIATLRYDKRTLMVARALQEGGSPDDVDLDLAQEVLDDAAAAVALLRADSRLDGDRIHLLGLSLGAGATSTVSRRLAEAGAPIAGLVMMAPPGRDLLTVMMDQYAYLAELGQMPEEDLANARADAERLRGGDVNEEEIILHAKPGYWQSLLAWRPWRDYLEQPAPALILFGERDYQITAPDRATWEATLAGDGRKGSDLEVLPGLNHLFLPGEGTPGPTEYGIAGELGDELLDRVGNWILATGAP